MNVKIELQIRGMHCASCSANVEKALNKIDGVSKAAVNLATEKATFFYDVQIVDLSAIKQAIEKDIPIDEVRIGDIIVINRVRRYQSTAK